MATIDVVVPALRQGVEDLVWSMERQTKPPHHVLIVSNEVEPFTSTIDTQLLRFTSEKYPYGRYDTVLRFNIGIWEADSDIVVIQGDDHLAPKNQLAEVERIMSDGRMFMFGHHRFIDFAPGREAIVDLDPEAGATREHPPNHLHMYLSGYGGMMAVRTSFLKAVGGFDMLFLGRHGNEDQNLCRRMLHAIGVGDQVFIYEPPFAWHPTVATPWLVGPTNLCNDGTHELLETNDPFPHTYCTRCPYRAPAEQDFWSDSIADHYDHSLVTVRRESMLALEDEQWMAAIR